MIGEYIYHKSHVDFRLLLIKDEGNNLKEKNYSDVLGDISLKDIIMFYITSNKDFKKKLKKTIKKLSPKEEEEPKKVTKKKRKRTVSEEIDFDKMEFAPRPKGNGQEKEPFQRIKTDYVPPALQDNSYEAYMKKTGDNFRLLANDKLKITRGKDFQKRENKVQEQNERRRNDNISNSEFYPIR